MCLNVPRRVVCAMTRCIIKDHEGLNWVSFSSIWQFQLRSYLLHEFDEVNFVVSIVNSEDWPLETISYRSEDRRPIMSVVDNNFDRTISEAPSFASGHPRVEL